LNEAETNVEIDQQIITRKIVFVVGQRCVDFLNYIRGGHPGGVFSYHDPYQNVYYILTDLSEELSLFNIETLRQKIQILFIYDLNQPDLFENDLNEFKGFLKTLTPLNRVLLTQYVSIVNIASASLELSRYTFSIGVFNLKYEEGRRYYSIHKPTIKLSSSMAGKLYPPLVESVRVQLSIDDNFIRFKTNSNAPNPDTEAVKVLSLLAVYI